MTTFAPRHCDIWPWTNWYSAVGSPTRTNDTAVLGMARLLIANAQNNEVVWNVALDSGTWTLTTIGYTYSGYGIQTWSLDGTSIGTLDWYGATLPNIVKQISGFTVSTAAVYALKVKMATKNASSSGYACDLSIITLTRTGA